MSKPKSRSKTKTKKKVCPHPKAKTVGRMACAQLLAWVDPILKTLHEAAPAGGLVVARGRDCDQTTKIDLSKDGLWGYEPIHVPLFAAFVASHLNQGGLTFLIRSPMGIQDPFTELPTKEIRGFALGKAVGLKQLQANEVRDRVHATEEGVLKSEDSVCYSGPSEEKKLLDVEPLLRLHALPPRIIAITGYEDDLDLCRVTVASVKPGFPDEDMGTEEVWLDQVGIEEDIDPLDVAFAVIDEFVDEELAKEPDSKVVQLDLIPLTECGDCDCDKFLTTTIGTIDMILEAFDGSFGGKPSRLGPHCTPMLTTKNVECPCGSEDRFWDCHGRGLE